MGSPELQVSGGAGGMDARLEDLATLARNSDDLALTLASISAECHAMLADPDVLASAVLDPGGAAKFETALLDALDGPGGLTALSVRFGARAVTLRTVVASYQASDEAGRLAIDSIRWTAGHVLADNPTPTLMMLGILGAPLAAYPLAGGEIDYERLLTDHPGIVDNLVGASPGLINGLGGPPMDVPGAAHLVALFYPDGRPMVVDAGVDTMNPSMTTPPAGFADLMEGLDYRNGQARPGAPDQIDVRVITHPDGSKAYIVDLPGTKVWDLPGGHNDALNDLGTNVHAMGDDATTRQTAIADALRQAGASSTDPVMLVGHSQGGIVAAQIAQDAGSGTFSYNVTHVVTAGAPIGRIDIPGNVQVLALENAHDIVAHLDAADNPDRPNLTTVTFDNQYGSIGNNHATDKSYLPAAQALDTSTDPSVTAYRNSAGAFLTTGTDGTTVEAHVYDMTRLP